MVGPETTAKCQESQVCVVGGRKLCLRASVQGSNWGKKMSRNFATKIILTHRNLSSL